MYRLRRLPYIHTYIQQQGAEPTWTCTRPAINYGLATKVCSALCVHSQHLWWTDFIRLHRKLRFWCLVGFCDTVRKKKSFQAFHSVQLIGKSRLKSFKLVGREVKALCTREKLDFPVTFRVVVFQCSRIHDLLGRGGDVVCKSSPYGAGVPKNHPPGSRTHTW